MVKWKLAATSTPMLVSCATEISKVLSKVSLTTAIHSGRVFASGAVGAAVCIMAEFCYNACRYWKEDITGPEWVRLTGKSMVRNLVIGGTSYGCSVGGAKIGALLGTAVLPGLGSAIGFGIGLVSGILLGFYLGKKAEEIYEDVLPAEEEAARRKILHEALLYFQLQKRDILNAKVFNKKTLHKKFRELAMHAHPDKRDGDHSEWYRLSTYYGVLKALLDENASNKKKAVGELDKISLAVKQ